jgi:hypothetical protein
MFDWLFQKKKTPSHYQELAAPPFPFPVHVAPADQAMAVYDAIKGKGEGLPLFLGGADDVANLAHMADLAAKEPAIVADTLAMAAAFRFPKECWNFADGTIPEVHDDIAELRASPGTWPDRVEAQTALPALIDLKTGQPRTDIRIAIIPTHENAAIPAHLNFGGWNACPYPHVLVAALRKWNKDWGAELVAMTSDTMEVRFPRKPATRAAALDLYLEMVALHSDTLMDGDPAQFAAEAMVSEYWQFWWD